MRIAAVIPELAVSGIYRSLIPLQALAHRGHAVHVEERNEIQDPRPLLESDLVQFMRFYHPAMVRMARRLKREGVAVVWDNDDDLAVMGPDRPDGRDSAMTLRARSTGIAAMVRCADVVTTPSDVLADRYRRLEGAPVQMLENYLPPTFTRPSRVPPHPGVVIGWLAALEHQTDVERLRLRDVLTRLLAQHPHLEVISVGLGLGLRSSRYAHYPTTPYGQLPELLSHFDVGLAPLADTPFNRARSNVKLKEYAALGVPWLASPAAPYADLGEEQGGRLVADDDWYREIERLIVDAGARSRLARRGRLWARTQTIEQHVDRWEQLYGAAIANAGRDRDDRLSLN